MCGYGPMGRMHAKLMLSHADTEIVGVADVQESARAQAQADLNVPTWNSAEELLAARRADIALIATPTYLHSALTIQACETGHHVFCEKPMGRTVAECDAMIAAASRYGKMLMIGQVLRFWPEYVYLKQTIAAGTLGRLQTLSMVRIGGVTHGYQDWFLDEARGGTQFLDRHLHDTDAVVWLLGKPEAVQAYGTQAEVGGFVHTFTRYEYPEITVSAEGSADLPANFPFTMSFLAVFERGAIEYTSRNQPTLRVYGESGKPEAPELPNPLGSLQTGLNITATSGYFLEQCYFLECVRSGRQPEIAPPESTRETIRIVRAEMQSAKEEKRIAIR